MLSMTLDLDDDVSIMILNLTDTQRPISMDQFFLIRMRRLIEHISLIADLIIVEKLFKTTFKIFKLKMPRCQLNDIGLSKQFRRLQKEHEIYFYLKGVFCFKLTHTTPNIEIISHQSLHPFPHSNIYHFTCLFLSFLAYKIYSESACFHYQRLSLP